MKKARGMAAAIAIAVLLCAIVPVRTYAAEESGKVLNQSGAVNIVEKGKCGTGAKYKLTEAGTLIISGTGKVADQAFMGRNDIRKVTIKKGITGIGEGVFWQCAKIKSVSFPAGLKKIGDSAFQECSSLLKVKLPNTVTSIGVGAFAICPKLSSVTLSKRLKTLGSHAFDSSGIQQVKIYGKVENWGGYVFADCKNLTSVVISKGVETVGSNAFTDCSALTDLTLPAGLKGVGWYAFFRCSSLTKLTLPDSLEYISCAAFGGTGIASVTIPAKVTSVRGFQDCKNLKAVYFKGDQPEMYDVDTFKGDRLTAWYPAGNSTWAQKTKMPSAKITWKAMSAPVIETQPGSRKVKTGKKVQYSVTASSAKPKLLRYQWQYSKDGKTWKNSSATGAKTNCMTLKAKVSRNGLYYRCVVTDAVGNRTKTKKVRLYVTK